MVCVELPPATGPVLLTQDEVAPLILQVSVPPGAVAPEIPVTVAVKVIVPPKIGFEGELVTAIVGVACVTVTEVAVVAGSDE